MFTYKNKKIICSMNGIDDYYVTEYDDLGQLIREENLAIGFTDVYYYNNEETLPEKPSIYFQQDHLKITRIIFPISMSARLL